MRRLFSMSVVLLAVVSLMLVGLVEFISVKDAHAAGPTCTLTGFYRDGMNLTAAVINPTGTYNAVLNASGCNIGVYYGPGATGKVLRSEIYGANYFGIVNNGGSVVISNSFIHDIGEVPFNGSQHGVGIYFAYGATSSGHIMYNHISRYQKGGIVVNGTSSLVKIERNTVTGLGPVNFIAQNGIEVGYGAQANVFNNTVTGNSYTGMNFASSGGILLFGGSCYGGNLTTNVHVSNNNVVGNDVGVWLSDLVVDPNNANNCLAPSTSTNVQIYKNTITNDAVNNVSGYIFNGAPAGYQAGISDAGNHDKITFNSICGVGYTPPAANPPILLNIDITYAFNVLVKGNKSCGSGAAVNGASTALIHGAQQMLIARASVVK